MIRDPHHHTESERQKISTTDMLQEHHDIHRIPLMIDKIAAVESCRFAAAAIHVQVMREKGSP
jgi:hypothetical protein